MKIYYENIKTGIIHSMRIKNEKPGPRQLKILKNDAFPGRIFRGSFYGPEIAIDETGRLSEV
jgi:hypothetical protein